MTEGVLPARNLIWAALGLKPGAEMRTSMVWPARYLSLPPSDLRTSTSPRRSLPVSFLERTGHPRPAQRNSNLAPLGGLEIVSCVSVNLGPLKDHLAETPEVTVGNGSASPSQFSSTRLPRISSAPGRIAADASLQS